MSRQDGN